MKRVVALPVGDLLHGLAPWPSEVAPRQELRVFSDFQSVAFLWREFEAVAEGSVFQRFDWLCEWYRYVGVNCNMQPVIVVGYTGAEVTFLLPLAVQRRNGIHRLIWLGLGVCDYNGPLLSPNFAVADFVSLWQDILATITTTHRVDVVDFDYMPTIIGSLPNPFLMLPEIQPSAMRGHAAKLTDDWQTFYAAKASTSTRHTDRRKMRRLQAIGPVKYTEITDQAAINDTLSILLRQKHLSYARMGVVDILTSDSTAFYRAIVNNPHLRDIVHITRVDAGDIPAATGLGLRFQGVYHLIMSSYQPEVSVHSPGRLHILELLQYAIAQGMHTFDFTIGDESYKLQWSDVHADLYSYVQGYTIQGRASVVLGRLIDALNSWYTSHGAALKRLVRSVRRHLNTRRNRKNEGEQGA